MRTHISQREYLIVYSTFLQTKCTNFTLILGKEKKNTLYYAGPQIFLQSKISIRNTIIALKQYKSLLSFQIITLFSSSQIGFPFSQSGKFKTLYRYVIASARSKK